MSYVEVSGLSKAFALRGGAKRTVRAVTDVSFAIPKGKTYGLVGESGSGKSTVAQMIVGLVSPDSGTIEVGGQSLTGDRAARGRYLQQLSIVFQSPFSSLDPKMTVLRIVSEPLRAFRRYAEDELEARVGELLQIVGLAPDHMFRYPHEFSGGQRQRIAIARAIAANPSLLVLDEPTSALDVSVQARIVNLLARLQASESLTYLFISHNIGVVRHLSNLLGVMYRGRLMETGDSETIIESPRHPYTQYLIAAVPRMENAAPSVVPEAAAASTLEASDEGCPFAPRCPKRLKQCVTVFPAATVLSAHQTVSCHLYG